MPSVTCICGLKKEKAELGAVLESCNPQSPGGHHFLTLRNDALSRRTSILPQTCLSSAHNVLSIGDRAAGKGQMPEPYSSYSSKKRPEINEKNRWKVENETTPVSMK
jgi:hypothetical protein